MDNQKQRAEIFKALHERPGIFVVPNPWDAGSAKILEKLGFEALTTTSAGFAFTIGKPDHKGAVDREETLGNIRAIVEATTLPVAGDLENGFGDEPQTCAETILLAARAGLVGGSIEDASDQDEAPIYPFELAVERVKSAVRAARSLPFPFMLAARSENYLYGREDLKDTIRRLEAFADAGADVLFAPGIKTREEIAAVVRAVAPKPVNVIMGRAGESLSLGELEQLGVKRVSVGSSLARAALGAFLKAAQEIKEQGTFNYARDAAPFAQINEMFKA
jgi:2-methylisocitrate lyase-like PEP mutase family enzyme